MAHNADQTKIGMRINVMPLQRIFIIVAIKLIPASNVPNPGYLQ